VIILLTGERGIGKTTVCQRVVELVTAGGGRVAGILTPVCPNTAGEKVAIDLVDLYTGQRRVLARADGAEKLVGPRWGRWQFDAAALSWGNAVLARAVNAEADLLVVDEIGPLELECGQGFVPVLADLRAGRIKQALVVVRPEYLSVLRERLAPSPCRIFVATLSNRGKLPKKILWTIEIAAPSKPPVSSKKTRGTMTS